MSDTFPTRSTLVWAGIVGALGVTLGSFGAHGLEAFLEGQNYDSELVSKRLDQWNTGVRYHMYHGLALLGLAAAPLGSSNLRRWIGRLFVAGTVLFSGSLYALTLTNLTQFGMVAPIGGLCWIVGWVLLIPAAWSNADS